MNASPSPGPQERRLRVLVVDDHDVVHWGFRLMLTQQPWVDRCLNARSGAQALALAAKLRGERPDMRVIFMSGHARPMLNASDALSEDMPLIQKPFMADELLAKIAEVMSA